MIDFIKLPIGTKVWGFSDGWGIITDFVDNEIYPIAVAFENDNKDYFTKYGYLYTFDINPSLFLSEFKISDEAYKPPLPDLKIDDKVIVWRYDNEKHRRHFSHFNKSNKIHCFENSKTSWTTGSTVFWEDWELPEDKE